MNIAMDPTLPAHARAQLGRVAGVIERWLLGAPRDGSVVLVVSDMTDDASLRCWAMGREQALALARDLHPELEAQLTPPAPVAGEALLLWYLGGDANVVRVGRFDVPARNT